MKTKFWFEWNFMASDVEQWLSKLFHDIALYFQKRNRVRIDQIGEALQAAEAEKG